MVSYCDLIEPQLPATYPVQLQGRLPDDDYEQLRLAFSRDNLAQLPDPRADGWRSQLASLLMVVVLFGGVVCVAVGTALVIVPLVLAAVSMMMAASVVGLRRLVRQMRRAQLEEQQRALEPFKEEWQQRLGLLVEVVPPGPTYCIRDVGALSFTRL